MGPGPGPGPGRWFEDTHTQVNRPVGFRVVAVFQKIILFCFFFAKRHPEMAPTTSENYEEALRRIEACAHDTKKTKLDLRELGLTKIPLAVFGLTHLTTLFLGWNKIRELPPAIGRLKNLRVLSLWDNEELESVPKELGDLEELRELNLWRCGLKFLPKEVGNLKKLEKLFLCENELKKLPATLAECKELQTLRLDKNDKLHQLPRGVVSLPKLKL